MNHSAPWMTRIFELLADGPQPIEYLIAEVRNMVPPGRAYRKAEDKRVSQAARRVNKTDRKGWTRTPTEDETIRTGQRQIVQDSITKLVRAGRLEYIPWGAGRGLQLGRPAEKGGLGPNHPLIKKLNEHQATYTKRLLPIEDVTDKAGRPVFAVDITCSCGWTWSGARQDPDGDWHIHATQVDRAKIAFTAHRRSFV